jgi:hypothetical protein
MRKNLIILILFFIILIMGLSGCNENVKNDLNNNEEKDDGENFKDEIPEPEIIKYQINQLPHPTSSWRVCGFIENVATVNLCLINVSFNIYDVNDNIIKKLSSKTIPNIVEPNSTAFFYLIMEDIDYYDHYDVKITQFIECDYEYYKDFSVKSNSEIRTEPSNSFFVYGSINNNGSKVMRDINIYGILYDKFGNIISVSYYDDIDYLISGQNEDYGISYDIGYKYFLKNINSIDNYEVIVDFNIY